MNEFNLIEHYFKQQTKHRADVTIGIGDDAAVLKVPSDQELIITTDTLVNGVHFPASAKPYDIGYKALAVNLSDLAAMGAQPAWITLALTLPDADENWLQAFCAGLFTLANQYNIQLIGGDMTRGPLSITIQAMGFAPHKQAILRSNAQVDDLIYVTGSLGDAGFALAHLDEPINASLLDRLHKPQPRVEAGMRLRQLAHAAIDVSDGLSADLGHILAQSQMGAIVYVDQLPLSAALKAATTESTAIQFALSAGDDYELCFTIPAYKQAELEQILADIACPYTRIGIITKQPGLILQYSNGSPYQGISHGYQHF